MSGFARNRPSSRRRGLTLIEVLSTLALFSLLLLAVASGLQAASRVAREVKERIIVQNQASNLIALISSLDLGGVAVGRMRSRRNPCRSAS